MQHFIGHFNNLSSITVRGLFVQNYSVRPHKKAVHQQGDGNFIFDVEEINVA
jgi:hypothetical protein